MKNTIVLITAFFVIQTVHSNAQDASGSTPNAMPSTPSTMFYQGYVSTATGTPLASGTYVMIFALYNVQFSGTALWQETHSNVRVSNGLFSVLLGKGSPPNPILLPFDEQYFLGIKVGADPEYPQRVQLSTTPYSFHAATAENAHSVDWASIRNIPAGFADGIDNTGGTGSAGVSSLNGKTGDLSFTAGSNVTLDNTNPSNIVISASGGSGGGDMLKSVYDQNSNGKVDVAELAYSVEDGSISQIKIQDGAVKEAKLADNAVSTAKIQDYAVTQIKIQDGAVKEVKLADNAVTQSKILDGVVKEAKLADNAVSTAKIQDYAVTQIKIQDGSIKVMKLADNAVTQPKINAAGAAAGKYLSFDGTNMIWQTPSSGGFTLPFAGTANGSAPAFAVSNNVSNAIAGYSATGPDAILGIASNSSNSGVVGRNYSSGNIGLLGGNSYGVYGRDSGSGNFGYLANNNYGVYGKNGATGNYGYLGSATEGVYAYANATGGGLSALRAVVGPGSSAAGLQIINGGSERGIDVNTTAISSSDCARFTISSSTHSGAGVYATTGGTGNAGRFTITAPLSSAAAVLVNTAGTGMAGRFEIDNTSNNSAALWAQTNGTGKAGYFLGNVQIVGTLSKSSGTFQIDHPLDPENKYLFHSFVESPDMMNVYRGTVRLDAQGEASVELPSYFEALNIDFDYQLTPVGAPMPNLYIAQEVSQNAFRIAGGIANAKVSWMVTGVRNDPYAQKHRVVPEVDKEPENRSRYLNPVEWNQPTERGISTHRDQLYAVPVRQQQ